MNNTSKMQIVPAARGGHVANGWQHKPQTVTEYTVKMISRDTTRVLLEGNNGISIWFDTTAIRVPFNVGQILELSEVNA